MGAGRSGVVALREAPLRLSRTGLQADLVRRLVRLLREREAEREREREGGREGRERETSTLRRDGMCESGEGFHDGWGLRRES